MPAASPKPVMVHRYVGYLSGALLDAGFSDGDELRLAASTKANVRADPGKNQLLGRVLRYARVPSLPSIAKRYRPRHRVAARDLTHMM